MFSLLADPMEVVAEDAASLCLAETFTGHAMLRAKEIDVIK